MRSDKSKPLDYASPQPDTANNPSSAQDTIALLAMSLLIVHLPIVLSFFGSMADGPSEWFMLFFCASIVTAPIGFILGLIGFTGPGTTRVAGSLAALLHGIMLFLILRA